MTITITETPDVADALRALAAAEALICALRADLQAERDNNTRVAEQNDQLEHRLAELGAIERDRDTMRVERNELEGQLRIARASIDRLETIVRSTDYKDVYGEALEIGKALGAPALVHAKATIARVERLCEEGDKRGAPYADVLRRVLRGER